MSSGVNQRYVIGDVPEFATNGGFENCESPCYPSRVVGYAGMFSIEYCIRAVPVELDGEKIVYRLIGDKENIQALLEKLNR